MLGTGEKSTANWEMNLEEQKNDECRMEDVRSREEGLFKQCVQRQYPGGEERGGQEVVGFGTQFGGAGIHFVRQPVDLDRLQFRVNNPILAHLITFVDFPFDNLIGFP